MEEKSTTGRRKKEERRSNWKSEFRENEEIQRGKDEKGKTAPKDKTETEGDTKENSRMDKAGLVEKD